jgi:hypothetical protein
MRRFPEPRRWTLPELQAQVAIARRLYAGRRPTEGRDAYRIAFADAVAEVTDLLDSSDDLHFLDALLLSRPSLIGAARYLDAPPISEDDLATVSGVPKTSLTATSMARRSPVLRAGLDADRFPWIFARPPRSPTRAERASAIRITAALLAAQRAATVLRNRWAARQEAAVKQVLAGKGYAESGRRRILAVGDLPAGEFSPESMVFGKKCDVPVGLRNGRYLLLECKVSGSEVNSYKRLNHETVNKHDRWQAAFGGQAYTAGVLGGVFSPANVLAAQDEGVFVFWEHDLAPLAEFLDEVG